MKRIPTPIFILLGLAIGIGLGLAIGRGIVMAHNGRIWVESDGYDEDLLPGSRFHIVLPVKQPE